MSSFRRENIVTYQADGSIAKGKAVTIGSDKQHVAVASSTTAKTIGITQVEVTGSGSAVEVARPGGGAKALAQTTIAAGKLLTAHTDGSLKPVAAANDRVIAVAMEDAVANDLFSVEVLICQATATET